MTHERRTFAYILIGTLILCLVPHLWRRELEPDLPMLPKMAQGCKADLVVGWLDCMTVFK